MTAMTSNPPAMETQVSPQEIARVQKYLREKFSNNRLRIGELSKQGDSVEVMLEEEFIGVIYRDDEDGEVSYDFNMAILEIDLPAA